MESNDEKHEEPVEKDAVTDEMVEEPGQFDCLRRLISETIHGYVFWSLFQGLAPMIWFYPLNELEISGYEAFAALWFLPIITGFSSVLRILQSPMYLSLTRLVMVASLASFQAPTTLTRLIVLAVGNGIAMLNFTALLWHPNKHTRCLFCWGLILGLMAFITSRIWLVSFVPTWWSNQTNSVVIAIGLVAALDNIVAGSIQEVKSTVSSEPLKRPFSLLTALGFGSLLYLTQALYGEVSVITRWTVRSYPDHGPDPYPWGIGTLLAITMGIYMSACRHVATSKIWWLIGTISFAALYYLPTWQGYCGGLVLAVYTLSVWPEMIERLSRCPPARSVSIFIIIYMIWTFFSVWTVAFNFVPGGVYTRERTDITVFGVMALIGLGLFLGGDIGDAQHTAYVPVRKKKMPSNNVQKLLVLFLCVGLLGFGSRYNPQRYNHPAKKAPKQFTSAIWTYHFGYDNKGWPSLERTFQLLNDTGADVITLLESDASKPFLGNNDLGMWLEERMGMYVDYGPSTKDHTWGKTMPAYLQYGKELFASWSCNNPLTGLQGPDPSQIDHPWDNLGSWVHDHIYSQLPHFPNRNTSWLNNANAFHKGNLVLSKWPIVKSTHHLLPSPEGELAPGVTITVNISGSMVDFVTTHMGNDRDRLDRKLQADFLAKELKNCENPVVFMGYVTSKPSSREYGVLINDGKVKDIDATDRKRFCEYIMYRGLRRIGYARITHGGLSDTEVQVGRFEIPENPNNYEDNVRTTTDPEDVPEHVRFHSRFGDFYPGHGYFSDHRFHMSTPKYFLP